MRLSSDSVSANLAGSAAALDGLGNDNGLDHRAMKLFATLPDKVCLALTRQRYPHVLNQVAQDWGVPRRLLALMDSLLLDTRGGRQGFAFDAVIELIQLREYYLDAVHPELRPPVTRRDPGIWY